MDTALASQLLETRQCHYASSNVHGGGGRGPLNCTVRDETHALYRAQTSRARCVFRSASLCTIWQGTSKRPPRCISPTACPLARRGDTIRTIPVSDNSMKHPADTSRLLLTSPPPAASRRLAIAPPLARRDACCLSSFRAFGGSSRMSTCHCRPPTPTPLLASTRARILRASRPWMLAPVTWSLGVSATAATCSQHRTASWRLRDSLH